jgi:hypothetical protein
MDQTKPDPELLEKLREARALLEQYPGVLYEAECAAKEPSPLELFSKAVATTDGSWAARHHGFGIWHLETCRTREEALAIHQLHGGNLIWIPGLAVFSEYASSSLVNKVNAKWLEARYPGLTYDCHFNGGFWVGLIASSFTPADVERLEGDLRNLAAYPCVDDEMLSAFEHEAIDEAFDDWAFDEVIRRAHNSGAEAFADAVSALPAERRREHGWAILALGEEQPYNETGSSMVFPKWFDERAYSYLHELFESGKL